MREAPDAKADYKELAAASINSAVLSATYPGGTRKTVPFVTNPGSGQSGPSTKLRGMKISRFVSLSVLACLAASQLTPAVAQYKWRDATGKIQYSDRPPPAGTPEKDVLSQPRAASQRAAAMAAAQASAAGAASAPEAPSVKASDPELEARKRKEKEQQDAKRKAEEEKQAKDKQENCQRARGYQRSLEDGQRITRTNDKGEREFLDDQQRAQELERTKQGIAQNCK
jgi:hypothetical protein